MATVCRPAADASVHVIGTPADLLSEAHSNVIGSSWSDYFDLSANFGQPFAPAPWPQPLGGCWQLDVSGFIALQAQGWPIPSRCAVINFNPWKLAQDDMVFAQVAMPVKALFAVNRSLPIHLASVSSQHRRISGIAHSAVLQALVSRLLEARHGQRMHMPKLPASNAVTSARKAALRNANVTLNVAYGVVHIRQRDKGIQPCTTADAIARSMREVAHIPRTWFVFWYIDEAQKSRYKADLRAELMGQGLHLHLIFEEQLQLDRKDNYFVYAVARELMRTAAACVNTKLCGSDCQDFL